MSQGVPATDPLRVFLSGKREHTRHAVSMAIEVGGLQRQFAGRVLDLSVGGAQLALSQSSLEEARHDDEDVFHVVARELAEGFDLQFPDAGVVVEAHPVRLCIEPGDECTVYLGCRFVEALSKNLRRRLGIRELMER